MGISWECSTKPFMQQLHARISFHAHNIRNNHLSCTHSTHHAPVPCTLNTRITRTQLMPVIPSIQYPPTHNIKVIKVQTSTLIRIPNREALSVYTNSNKHDHYTRLQRTKTLFSLHHKTGWLSFRLGYCIEHGLTYTIIRVQCTYTVYALCILYSIYIE